MHAGASFGVHSGLYTLPEGDPAQTRATIGYMRSLALAGAASPVVRNQAAFLVAGDGRNQLAYIETLAGWITDHTRFLFDPAPFEALVPADAAVQTILAQGVAQFDCDDVAILAAALGLSVGLRARFVAVAFHADDAPFEHVWAELTPSNAATWFAVDPSRPATGLPTILRPPLIVEV